MNEELIQNSTQPFIKLAQSNMDLVTKMLPTPEAMNSSMAEVEKLFHQPTGLSGNITNVNAFGQLAHCMFSNYTVFMMEMGRYATQCMLQGQDNIRRSTQQATEAVDQGSRRYQQEKNHLDRKVSA